MAQYDSQAIVTIECGTTGAIIRYTLDGTNPSATAGTEYSAPFTLYNNTTVKAIGIKSGMNDSDIATESITVKLPNKSDMFNFTMNSFGDIATWVLAYDRYSEAYSKYGLASLHVRYTLDGSEPTAESPEALQNHGITIRENCTLKWKVFGTNNVASDTLSDTVSTMKVRTPEITVE